MILELEIDVNKERFRPCSVDKVQSFLVSPSARKSRLHSWVPLVHVLATP